MPPQLALVLTLAAVVYMLRKDQKYLQGGWGLLVPALWLAVVSSRAPAYWFQPPSQVIDERIEGNSLNLLVHAGLMLAALIILSKRRFSWGETIRDNFLIFALYGFLLASAVWSEFSVVSAKRLVKDFGALLMALVVLTEPDPFFALRLMFVRCSYVIFPLSVCFIKYFPAIGRMYSKSWEPMFTGVSTHKNSLGAVTFILLTALVVDLMSLREAPKQLKRLRYAMLATGAWLLLVSDSKTSLVCLIVALATLRYSLRLSKSPRPIPSFLLVLSITVAGAFFMFSSGLISLVTDRLGRDTSMTGRDAIWHMIGEQHTNAIIGEGYLAFWDSTAARLYREAGNNEIVSAHNGYLDLFIDGGAIALTLFAVLFFSVLFRTVGALPRLSLFDRFRLSLLIAFAIHNWSESTILRLGPLWMTFLIISLKCAPQVLDRLKSRESRPETQDSANIPHTYAALGHASG